MFIVDVARTVSTRFTFGGTLSPETVWSPDGRYIAYAALANGGGTVVKKRSDGSSPEEAIGGNAAASGVCDWSRDGKWILYTNTGEGTQNDLWVLPATGDGQPRPFLQTKAIENCGQFSPDGKWVAYASDESGAFQVYVQGFPTGGKWQISKDTGTQPRWRRDGKELFFYSQDGNLMAADIRAGTAIEPGIPKKMFPVAITGAQTGINYDVSLDGQKFVIPMEARSTVAEPITAILNWTSLLKK